MKTITKIVILSALLISPVWLLSSEASIKRIVSAKDLPSSFCSVWKKGDFLITTENYWAIIGASSRHLGLSSGNYPTDNAIGNIISFVPAKTGLQSDMAIGAPLIRIKNKRKLIHYSRVKPGKSDGTDTRLEIEAEAIYEEEGKGTKIHTKYTFFSKKGDKTDVRALIHSLKKGNSFSSNGPFIEFAVNDNYGPGDLFSSQSKEVKITVKVQSASWVSVDMVRIIINGERKLLFPVKAERDSIVKFAEDITIPLREDSYIAIEVMGAQSLYPVLQAQASEDSKERVTLPYALTNPVFVDIDGNGRFDPPNPEKIKLREIADPINKTK